MTDFNQSVIALNRISQRCNAIQGSLAVSKCFLTHYSHSQPIICVCLVHGCQQIEQAVHLVCDVYIWLPLHQIN